MISSKHILFTIIALYINIAQGSYPGSLSNWQAAALAIGGGSDPVAAANYILNSQLPIMTANQAYADLAFLGTNEAKALGQYISNNTSSSLLKGSYTPANALAALQAIANGGTTPVTTPPSTPVTPTPPSTPVTSAPTQTPPTMSPPTSNPLPAPANSSTAATALQNLQSALQSAAQTYTQAAQQLISQGTIVSPSSITLNITA